jgi:hypothetical protein
MAERIACGLGNIDAKIAIFLCHPSRVLGQQRSESAGSSGKFAANNEAQNYRSS